MPSRSGSVHLPPSVLAGRDLGTLVLAGLLLKLVWQICDHMARR